MTAPAIDLPAGLVLEEATSPAGGYASAVYDTASTYRYLLTRIWDRDTPPAVAIMLNPSTATAETADPTLTRCLGYARRAGAGGLVIVNLFALRATNPARLRDHQDPVGPHNDSFIDHAVRGPGPVIAAWGAGGNLHDRATAVADRLWDAGIPLQCLGTTGPASGRQPRHPLYLAADTSLRPYAPAAA